MGAAACVWRVTVEKISRVLGGMRDGMVSIWGWLVALLEPHVWELLLLGALVWIVLLCWGAVPA